MAATIRDVARAAGVHISTVSRSFSNSNSVGADTRKRVLAIAEELGYRPNPAARSLITGRTQNLGVIVTDIANPFFPPLIKAAEGQARQRGYQVFIADTNEDTVLEVELVRALSRQVDGIVLCSPRMPTAQIEEISTTVPVVVVNRKVDLLPSVLMDVGGGAQQAMEHLVALGHRDIGLLTGPRGSWNSREIRRAAASVARAHDVRLEVLGPNSPTEESGLVAAPHVIDKDLTAVLAYNDLMAIGLMEGLTSHGRTIPGDVSVVGIDDIASSRYTTPKLTTVATPTAAAGRAAIDLLLQGGQTQHSIAHLSVDTHLVIRDSTGLVPSRVMTPHR